MPKPAPVGVGLNIESVKLLSTMWEELTWYEKQSKDLRLKCLCEVLMSGSPQKQAGLTGFGPATWELRGRQAGWEGQTLCELYQALKTGLVFQRMLVVGI